MTNEQLKLSDFDYQLPKEMIAQRPLAERDQSRLMVLNRADGTIEHHRFFELPELLGEDCVLVFNESRVIPARLKFKLGESNAEILLIKSVGEDTWECMVRPGPKFEPKTEGQIDDECGFYVKEITPHGLRVIKFKCGDFKEYLKKHGHTPTPPYIKEEVSDPEKYQTVYAKTEGSVAAPTAGFHFTDRVFADLKAKGIQTEFITLHVGLGTFQPVKIDNIKKHQMHSEWFSLPEGTADRLNQAKAKGKKIVAVGTTAVRVLESCSDSEGQLKAQSGETDIFIYPGYSWKFVDQLITNFHVPKSTLLMLVSAFANPSDVPPESLKGRDFILKAYEIAKKEGYRFFSFGDSMLIR
jgi:S-adenosylmethionine:tRNA ribosyltransferase-isomerase